MFLILFVKWPVGQTVVVLWFVLPSVDIRGGERGGHLGPLFRDAPLSEFCTLVLQCFVEKLVSHFRTTLDKLRSQLYIFFKINQALCEESKQFK